jgi:[acyl-carrier-protein] S-malonyltransferase
MQEAVPVGTGAMAAVLGSDLETVNAACAEAAQGQVCSAANINSSGQIVIAGDAAAIDRATEILKARGAKRAVKLNVSAPFHCALMMPAQDRLAVDLNQLRFNDLATPLVTNVDAKSIKTGAEARDSLIRQVSQPVRWLDSVEFLSNHGVQTLIEIGPGKVLSGLVRQINRELRCLNVEDESSLRATREAFAI